MMWSVKAVQEKIFDNAKAKATSNKLCQVAKLPRGMFIRGGKQAILGVLGILGDGRRSRGIFVGLER